jgi:hypothetical protein
MNASHQNLISASSNTAKRLLEIMGELGQENVLYHGSPNYKVLITQGEIDTVPALVGAGLTKTMLDDAEFALAAVNTTLTNALVALTMLARLP